MKETKIGTARKFFAENPSITAKDLAGKMGISADYAYGLLWKLKQNNKPKKLGRPKKKIVVNSAQMALLDAINKGRAMQRMKTIAVGISDSPMRDMVNHPAHYKVGGIETIDFIEAQKLSYNLGNVVKYITRADHKGSKRIDLEKARWYLNRELENLSKK